jgi:probable rRNA maturation factor
MSGLGKGFAGDIAISADIAAENAKQLRHSAAEEVKILALHGVLHLAGYDHERDNGKMAHREEQLRKSLGLPLGLIERNGRAGRPQAKAGDGGLLTPGKPARRGTQSRATRPRRSHTA